MPWPPPAEATDKELLNLKLSVDALNINIGTGDAAIYLLIQHPPILSRNDKPFIHRAVLIDGGETAAASDAIDIVLKNKIPQMYHFDKAQGGRANLTFPPFDALVVTHWDKDHFEGLVNLVEREVTKASEAALAKDPAKFQEWLDSYLCPYLKYNVDTTGTGVRDTRASSTFYAPYWELLGFPDPDRDRFTESTDVANGADPKGDGVFLHWNASNGDLVENICKLRAGLSEILGTNLFTGLCPPYNLAMKMTSPQHLAVWHKKGDPKGAIETTHPIKEFPPHSPDAWPVLAIVAGASQTGGERAPTNKCCGDLAVGRDVKGEVEKLTTKFEAQDGSDDFKDAEPSEEQEDLIQEHFSTLKDEMDVTPTVASVMAKATVTAHQVNDDDDEASDTIVTSTDMTEDLKERKPIRMMVVDSTTYPTSNEHDFTNMHSIVSMIIWTTGQLSSYQGGDANWEGEKKVVAWVQQPLNPFKCVRSVKLSHHGSAESTPCEMIRSFRPRNIIISFGRNNHGHPRWEIILWLKLWVDLTRLQRVSIGVFNTLTPRGIIRATAAPAYMIWDDPMAKYDKNLFGVFTPIVAPKGGAQKKFQASLARLIKQVGGTDWIANCVKLKGDKEGLKEYMRGETFKAWQELSEIGFEYVGLVNIYNEDRFTVVDPTKKVLFIKTHCRPSDPTRRLDADSYLDGASYPVKQENTDVEMVEASKVSVGSVQGAVRFVLGVAQKGLPPALRPLVGVGTVMLERASRKFSKLVQKVSQEKPYTRKVNGIAVGRAQSIKKTTTAFAFRVAESSLASGAQTAGELDPPPKTKFYLVTEENSKQWDSVVEEPVYQVPVGSTEDGDDMDEFSAFIMVLQQQALLVEKDFKLNTEDPLREWLLQAMHENPKTSTAAVSLSLTGTQSKTGVASMTLSIPGTESRPAMTFSTSTLAGNFSNMYDEDIPVTKSGFFPVHQFLALGLAPSSKTWNISQVFAQMNVDSKAAKSSGAVLKALLDKLTVVKIDFTLKKGMIWFVPAENYQTIQRLEWGLSTEGQKSLTNWCSDWLGGLSIKDPTLISRRECSRLNSPTNINLVFEHGMMVMFQLVRPDADPTRDYVVTCGLDLNLASGGNTLVATIRIDPASEKSEAGLLNILGWLVPEWENEFEAVSDMIPAIDNIQLRSVELRKAGSDASVDKITVKAEYRNENWKVVGPDGAERVVPLLLTYSWTKGRPQPHAVNVTVWLEPEILSWFPPQIMPRYEDLYFIRPWTPAPSYISLKTLMPGDYKLPAELSLAITELSMSLEDTTVKFTGKLESEPTEKPPDNLGIVLRQVSLMASYTWSDTKAKSQPNPGKYEINLYTEIALPAETSDVEDDDSGAKDAVITCNINLIKIGSDWMFQLLGTVADLNLAQLVNFFPDGDGEIVKSLLGHITIRTLNLEYNYEKTDPKTRLKPATATDFSIQAVLILDILKLDLKFIRRGNEMWSFDATLKTAEDSLTIEQILKALLGEEKSGSIADVPPFVKDIDLRNASLKLSLRSLKPAVGPNALSVCLALKIPGPENTMLEFAFLQITTKVANLTNIEAATKRLVKVTLGGLPWDKIPKLPVVDKINPAFDALGFYWVQDPTWKDASKQPGLSRQEVEKLNELSPVLFKEKKATTDGAQSPEAAKAAAATIVLDAGMHFMVLDSGGQGSSRAILDYVFNKPKLPTQAKVAGGRARLLAEPTVDSTPTGTSKATLEKTVGPFSVSNVGIRYENSELIIFLDIMANLGPIKLALMGFGFGINLKDTDLTKIVTQGTSFHLQGMGVEFNQPPVGVAGMFVERVTDDMKMYVGGISLTIIPYSFMAVGAYGEVKKPGGGTFKTVFFFAKLNGPLIELEFVTIGGICLGFGYNSNIRFPSIQEVPSFPFIANSSLPGDSPLAVMQKLSSTDPKTGIVSPQETSYWLAAGLSAKAMQVLDVSAVIILEFNPYVSLGIFAKAIGQMPPAPTPREACFLYVELGIAATVDFHSGAMRIEAQLSPNSFVINPTCHLTGGFALCYWFAPSPYAGDFVFTVGGYHNAFKPPGHYPVPPRLGITWAISDDLMITGQAYFAITPKVCMGGGILKANFNQGLLHAWLTAWADFLMEYHPFSFKARIGLEVGVSFTLELLFCSVDINVKIRAELTLWGVPFGGEVYVDFWVFGFTIGFGEDEGGEPPITMAKFRDLLIQVPDAESQAADSGSPTVDKLHVLSVESGRYTEKATDSTTKQGDIWEIKRGGFVFRVQSRVPLLSITEPGFPADSKKTTAYSKTAFYARPMHLQTQLISTMTVSVTQRDDKEKMEFTPVTPVLKQVPLAIWGSYDPKNSPGKGRNNIANLLDSSGGTAELMMGATFHGPQPHISEDKIVAFNVLEASSVDVFTNADVDLKDEDEHPDLNGDVVFQSDTWRSAAPVGGIRQWQTVRDTWKKPELIIPMQSLGEDGLVGPKDAVDATMALWSEAFSWQFGGTASNQVRNEVNGRGKVPIVWDAFETLYMAAPMLGVVT